MGEIVDAGRGRRLYWMRFAVAGVTLLALVVAVFGVPEPTARAVSTGDWPTYLGDNGRSGYNSAETAINPATVSNLQLLWQYNANGSISTQPIVANGMIYWGSWDGVEHATSLNGTSTWTKNSGVTSVPTCFPPTSVGVASSATVASVVINGTLTPVVYVGGGRAQFLALNANTGAVIWKTQLGVSPNHFIWSSPAVYNGSVYIGLASFGDCPLVRGALFQLDAVTGVILHTFYTVPSGCVGASVWGSPTIDETTGMLYFATGNGGSCSTAERFQEALIEVSATDLSLIASWQVPKAQRVGDGDFGTTPTLFQATINGTLHKMIGLINKSGIYYAFDRSSIGAGPLWQLSLTTGTQSISPSAWDGTNLYVATDTATVNGVSCNGSLNALNPATGAFIWQVCLHAKPYAAVTCIPGLLILGLGKGLVIFDAVSGSRLFHFQDSSTNSDFWGSASVSNGILYEGNMDGILYAFGLPSTLTSHTHR